MVTETDTILQLGICLRTAARVRTFLYKMDGHKPVSTGQRVAKACAKNMEPSSERGSRD